MNQDDIEKIINEKLDTWKSHERVEAVLKTFADLCKRVQSLGLEEENQVANEVIHEVINDFSQTLLKISQNFHQVKQKTLDKLQVINSKLKLLNEILEHSKFSPSDDLCWHDPFSDSWSEIRSVIEIIKSKNPSKTISQYKSFISKIALSQAFISSGLQESSTFKRNLMVGLSAIYYFFNKKSAERKKELSYAVCDKRIAITTWNLLDSWLCSKALSTLLPEISENTIIYIPRSFPSFSTSAPSSTPPDFSYTAQADYIPVRVLNSHLLLTQPSESFCCGTREKPAKRPRKIIFHIHGGGFISQSSNSHQMVTRRWAEDLKVPVFSVDYRLAPDHPYPAGLDDVWQAYNWLVSYNSTIGMKIKKIVLAGDSAGGNFSLVLAIKCILENVRRPDGLLLVYPAVYIDDKLIKKSFFKCLDDDVVPYSFLKMCKDMYLQDEGLDGGLDMMISPLVASDEIYEQLPKCRVVFGFDDPLRDYVVTFVQRMMKAGGDVKAKLFLDTPHGALNFFMPGGVKKAKHVYNATVGFIAEMLGLDGN